MFTLCIDYRLDPTKLGDFHSYARDLRTVVDRCGGRFVDYYLPTKFAGPTDRAIGLIDLADLATYEHYRKCLASDPTSLAVSKAVADAGCILGENRSLLRRA